MEDYSLSILMKKKFVLLKRMKRKKIFFLNGKKNQKQYRIHYFLSFFGHQLDPLIFFLLCMTVSVNLYIVIYFLTIFCFLSRAPFIYFYFLIYSLKLSLQLYIKLVYIKTILYVQVYIYTSDIKINMYFNILY